MDRQDFEKIYEAYKTDGERRAVVEQGMIEDQASPGQERIVAVRKNEDGDLIAFQTDSGRQLDYVTALQEAKAGKLAHIDVFHKYGRDILRSEPDGIKENNLDHLPEF